MGYIGKKLKLYHWFFLLIYKACCHSYNINEQVSYWLVIKILTETQLFRLQQFVTNALHLFIGSHFFHAFPGFLSRPNLIDAHIRKVCSMWGNFEGIAKKMVQYLSLGFSIMARTLFPPRSSSEFSFFLCQVLFHNMLVKHIDCYLNFPM